MPMRLFAILVGIVLIMWGIGFSPRMILEFLFPEAARQTRIEEEREGDARKDAESRQLPKSETNEVGEVCTPSE